MGSLDDRVEAIHRFIINSVKDTKPNTVEQLVQIVQKEFPVSKEEAVAHIIELNINGKLKFREPTLSPTSNDCRFPAGAIWYGIVLVLSSLATITIFTIPEDAFPLVYARYLLGSIFVFFLPGFCLIQVSFPQKEVDSIERTALSVGMSLAITALTSFLLNSTPWGITTTTVTLSLLALTVTFASASFVRRKKNKIINPNK